MIKPTKYEYEAPTRIAGNPATSTTKLDVTQTGSTWIATLHVTSIPCNSAGDAQTKLREELMNLITELGGSK
jgi:hypothetical protein